jgi:type IV pilus assembly protein PilC
MLNSGLSLTRALSVLERQAKPKSAIRKIVAALNESVNKGKSLSQALSEYGDIFSSLLISMVRSGEESGNLSESLKVVSTQMEKSYLLKKKIKGAMMYPTIIFSIMIIIGVLMLIYVVPTLTQTFKDLHVSLPASTQFIIAMSDFVQNHYLFLIFGVFGVIFGISFGKKTAIGKRWLSYTTLHIPIISAITRESNSAQTTRTLSSLLSAGVDVVHAMEITAEVTQNVFYQDVLAGSTETIQKGLPISQVFIDNPKIFPVFVGEMAAVYYEEEVEQKTKDMSTVIEPFLMVFIGAVVGFFAISMLMPTYSLVNAF